MTTTTIRAVIALLLLCPAFGAEEAHRRTAGKYRVTLRLPPDGLFAQEEMEIEMRIEDTSRPDALLGFSPVIRARVDAGISMPEMPGMPAFREVAHAEPIPGDYGFHPTFAHGGEYRLSLAIAPPEDQLFHLDFPLRVLDADSGRKARPPRCWLDIVSSPKTPKAGEPADLKLVVREREHPREVFASFELAHEKPMHLVIVRTDLTQFAHEHPGMSPDGVFQLRRTFAEAGEYRLFADIAPRNAGSQVLMGKLKVSGRRPELWSIASAPAAERSLSKAIGNLKIELKAESYPLPAKTSTCLNVSVIDRTTGPVTNLQDYLGAAGHLMLVHQDGVTFVHSHPGNALSFLVRPPKPGLYRGWLQLQRDNTVVTADFILEAVGQAVPPAVGQ